MKRKNKTRCRKGVRLLALLTLLLWLTSCAPAMDGADSTLHLTYRGQDICVGMEMDVLLPLLGEDYIVDVAQSCAGIGQDVVYTYPSLRLYAFAPVDGVAYVTSATYTDDGVDFCGIRIGSAVADVTAALGEPTEQNEQRVVYRDQTATLTFTLRDGYVSAIVLADNS